MLVEAQAFRKKEERVALIAGDSASDDSWEALRRALVAGVVIAAHIALVFALAQRVRRPAEVVEVFLTLIPITTEEQPRQQERSPELPATKTRKALRREVASATPSVPTNAQRQQAQEEPAPRETESSTAPVAPIDWYAEAQATASALEQRDRANRERRPLDRPSGSALAPDRHGKPPCPFEKCEPGWGAPPSVFDSTATKAGRIEKTADGEVIRWISNRCYQILVTPNILHRAMTRCVQPLGKKAARGDLFKHMKEPPPPADRATDVP
jgi:hypothetical protein